MKKQVTKKVKAWAILDKYGTEIFWSNFYPTGGNTYDIFLHKEDAEDFRSSEYSKVIPIEIIYSLPKSKKKPRP